MTITAKRRHGAMILAAGLGMRMRAYAPDLPKPLVEVAGRPLIDYSLELLKNADIRSAVVNTHYRAGQVEAYLAAQHGITVEISHEENLLETGGGVVRALPLLEDLFFVLNSDVICTDVTPPVLTQMRQLWDEEKMDALLLVIPVERATGYRGEGDFSLRTDAGCAGPLRCLDPGGGRFVFTGVQLLHRRFLTDVPEGAFSLSFLYRRALDCMPSRFYGFVHPGGWFHVGDAEGVREAGQVLGR